MEIKKDNAIIFYYPPGAGGKFLLSCLSLADNVAFPDVTISYKQLYNGITQQEKFDILNTSLDKVHTDWNDFLLVPKFFAMGANKNQFDYNFELINFLSNNLDKDIDIKNLLIPDQITEKLADKGIYFLTLTHSIFRLYLFSSYWKNSYIINFKNSIPFAKHYRKDYTRSTLNKNGNCGIYRYVSSTKQKYNLVSSSSWPKFKTVLKDGITDYNIYEQIKNNHKDLHRDLVQMPHIINFYKSLSKNKNVIGWNTNDFFDKTDTITNIKRVYKKLNLTNYNQEMISQLYDKWILKLKKVNRKKYDVDLFKAIEYHAQNNDFMNAKKYLKKLIDQ